MCKDAKSGRLTGSQIGYRAKKMRKWQMLMLMEIENYADLLIL